MCREINIEASKSRHRKGTSDFVHTTTLFGYNILKYLVRTMHVVPIFIVISEPKQTEIEYVFLLLPISSCWSINLPCLLAGLLWISWCVLGGADFFVFSFLRFCFSSNAHGLLQVRGRLASFTSLLVVLVVRRIMLSLYVLRVELDKFQVISMTSKNGHFFSTRTYTLLLL